MIIGFPTSPSTEGEAPKGDVSVTIGEQKIEAVQRESPFAVHMVMCTTAFISFLVFTVIICLILGFLYLVDQWIQYGQIFGCAHYNKIPNGTFINTTSTEYPYNDGTLFF